MNKLTTATRIAVTVTAGFIVLSAATGAFAKDGGGNGAGHAFGLSTANRPPVAAPTAPPAPAATAPARSAQPPAPAAQPKR